MTNTNHKMVISGSKAAWECATNEVDDAATSTLGRQYLAHIKRTKPTKAALLAAAAEAQTKYWEAVRELEAALGIELDGEDLSAVSNVTELRKVLRAKERA
jgi:hypothetical protein